MIDVVRAALLKLFDTTVGTFLGQPFGSTTTKYLKRWSEEGTDSGIEEPHNAARTTIDNTRNRFDSYSGFQASVSLPPIIMRILRI